MKHEMKHEIKIPEVKKKRKYVRTPKQEFELYRLMKKKEELEEAITLRLQKQLSTLETHLEEIKSQMKPGEKNT